MKGNYVVDSNRNKDGGQKNKFGVGYGFTDFWFSEVEAELEKSGAANSDYKFSAIEWENIIQVLEPGEYWLDLGLYGAFEKSFEGGGADKVEGKVLLAKNTQDFTHLANITLEKEIGANATESAEWELAWSTRYHYQPWLEPGFEVHSGFGEINHTKTYAEQSHQIGPVIYGDLPGGFKYDVGYLFGASKAANDGELKWIVEYEMRF